MEISEAEIGDILQHKDGSKACVFKKEESWLIWIQYFKNGKLYHGQIVPKSAKYWTNLTTGISRKRLEIWKQMI